MEILLTFEKRSKMYLKCKNVLNVRLAKVASYKTSWETTVSCTQLVKMYARLKVPSITLLKSNDNKTSVITPKVDDLLNYLPKLSSPFFICSK